MIAMLGMVIAMPLTSTYALAMAGKAHTTAATTDKMPCHKPAKPCPDCPQKVCPDIGTCLVKCFQTMSPPVAEARLQGTEQRARVLPARSQVSDGSLIPPLLRPPSV